MKKTESKFLQELERKAQEQRRMVGTEILPTWATSLGEWLVINPWRVLVPIAGITYYGLRMMLGADFRELILGLFGGFR